MKATLLFFLLPCLALADTPCVLAPIYTQLKVARPLQITMTPSGERLLLSQRGKVQILPKESDPEGKTKLFLDLSERRLAADKNSEFEEGLVGFSLHPNFSENQLCYAYYTVQEPKRAVLSEFKAAPGKDLKADPASERVLLTIPLPHWNHHGGNLVFGKDGLLYLGVGDGGGPQGGDPLRLAQNPFSYNGKILRIDVNSKSGDRAYSLPADNPWIKKPLALPEVVASGVRNPWGMAMDADGALWFADVGQNQFEEVNILEMGANYGWSFREGDMGFPARTDAPPADVKFTDPIHQYGRAEGISITGGVFYAGSALPDLAGAFIYGDWGTGRIWALRYDKAAKKKTSNTLLVENQPGAPPTKPTGFSLDENGEVLVLDWNGGILRLTPGKK